MHKRVLSLQPAVFIAILALLLLLLLTLLPPRQEVRESKTLTVTQSRHARLGSVPWVKLVIVVDNSEASKPGLVSTWGLSIYVETPNLKLLFDTGPSPTVLLTNAKLLKVDLRGLNCVVISHEHLDHVGGLEAFKELDVRVPVYVPRGFSPGVYAWVEKLGLPVREVDDYLVLSDGVAIVSGFYGPPWEEALVINVRGKGLVVVVGCSHCGVDKIVERVYQLFGVKPYMVIGGFHLIGASREKCEHVVEKLAELGAEAIAPLHCSGQTVKEVLVSRYPDKLVEARLGDVIVVHS